MWVLFFILLFRVLSRYPVGILTDVCEISFIAILFLISAFEFFRSLLAKKIDLLFLLLLPLAFVPFLSALQAKKVFSQPPLYGIATQREIYLFLGAYFIVKALVRGWVSLKNLERYFLYSLVFICFIILYFYIFVNPATYAGTEFVQYVLTKGWLFKFPSSIAAGIIFYSLIKIWRENNYLYYAHLMCGVILFVVFIQDRSQIAFIGVTSAILFLKDLNLQRKIVNLFYSVILLVFAAFIVVTIKPDLFDKYVQLYKNATAIFTGDNPHESSTRVRFYESAIAFRGLKAHYLLGSGILSGRWNDGYLGRFGYFYPADIGLLGNLYVYGIIGTLFFYIPIIAAFWWAWEMRRYRNTFYLTILYMLVFIVFDMFTAASNIIFIGQPMFCVGVIYY